MDLTVFLTVLSGVLTYVVGQLVVKLVIEPVQEARRTIGQISHSLIEHAHVIANPGVPAWWPGFCMAFDVVAGGLLAVLLLTRRPYSLQSRGPDRRAG